LIERLRAARNNPAALLIGSRARDDFEERDLLRSFKDFSNGFLEYSRPGFKGFMQR
jgi:hypothetical protein